MSTTPSSNPPGPRRPLPPHLVSDTPPTPSRSPSNASTAGDVSGGDQEDESADESDYPDGDPDDPHASTLELSHLGPAVATPKPSGTSPWPFNAPAGSATSGPASSSNATASNGSASGGGGGAFVSPTPEYALEQPVIPASSLPHEILLHILRLLPPPSLAPALRVCKAWCQCGVELLWHKLSFTSVAALYKMLQVLSLPEQTFPYPDFVRRINFHPLASEMSDRVVAKLLPCTRLERITLTSCKALSSAAMCALLVQSHRLVALDLTDVPNVDDDVLVALAANCPKVQGLNLSGCSRITDRGLEAIALGCPLLRRVRSLSPLGLCRATRSLTRSALPPARRSSSASATSSPTFPSSSSRCTARSSSKSTSPSAPRSRPSPSCSSCARRTPCARCPSPDASSSTTMRSRTRRS